MIKRRTLHIGLIASLMASALVVYQNCGELRPSASAVLELGSIERRAREDKVLLERLLVVDPMKVFVSAKLADAGARTIASIDGVVPDSLNLTAMAIPPTLVSAESSALVGSRVMEMKDGAGLQSALDANIFVSDRYSLVALVEGPALGPLFTFTTNTPGIQEAKLVASANGFTLTKLQGTSGSTSIYAPYQQGAGTFVIAVSIGSAPGDMKIQINGFAIDATPAVVEDPNAFSYLLRQLKIGGPGSTLRLAEILVFTEKLTTGELNAVSRFVGKRWGINNLNYIPNVVETGPETPVDNSAGIKLLTDNCVGCHHGGTLAATKSQLAGRSKEQIKSAIAGVSQMNSIHLSDAEISSISKALQ